jgi:hypothetical protein
LIRYLLLLPALAILLGTACDGGGSAPTPAATATEAPDARPTPPPGEPAEVQPRGALDLASEAALYSIIGADEGDLQTGGASMARGDFNSDGVDDLLLGAPFADGPDESREDAGEAYVIFGSASLGEEIDLASQEPDLVVYGALRGDNLGYSVAAGDLNGDGSDDVIAAAPGSNGLTNIRTDLGEAYVVFGSASLGGAVDVAEVEQDFTLRSAEGFTRLGTSLAIGDVNADGIEDLLAGGPFGGREEGTPEGSNRTTVGEVYVAFGRTGLSGEMSVARGEEDLRLKGAQERDGFGQGVAAGDFNGDGVDDVLVSANRADGPGDSRTEGGEAYVFYGSAELSGLALSTEADVTIFGGRESDALGTAVAQGDVDGDGPADMLIGVPFSGGPQGDRAGAGAVYVIFGDRALPEVIDLAEDAPGALLHGRTGNDFLPAALSLADLDGDGRSEAAISAARAGGPADSRIDGGEVYVFAGGLPAGATDLRVDPEAPRFVYGAAAGDLAGTSLLWLDLNGDGRMELLVLAPNGKDGRGTVYALDVAS